jgi:hypothetical protein
MQREEKKSYIEVQAESFSSARYNRFFRVLYISFLKKKGDIIGPPGRFAATLPNRDVHS